MIIKEIDVRSIMTKTNLPVSDYAVNPYVDCAHACKYCYASFMKRFTNHTEPRGEFVDIKNWPEIKRPEKYAGKELFFCSVTDPYQPLEVKYERTRSLLKQLQGSGVSFLYDNEEFSAQYTAENWKIVDSYKISNTQDMILICQALLNIHPVHGRDMQSIRTAEDMTFEWLQHNLAYAILPEDSPWRQNAKDVDLNPADQGKSFQEMYEDRTGRKFRVGDFIG